MANVYMGKDIENFIFTEGTVYESEISKEELNKFGVIECTDDNVDIAFYKIALENEQNFNNIQNSIMKEKFVVLESSEIVNEADESDSKVKKIINNIKEIIQRFWSRIMGVFKKIKETISSKVNDKRFKSLIEKYKGKKLKTPDKRFVSGYDFEDTLLKTTEFYNKVEKITGQYSTFAFSISKNYENGTRGDELKDYDEYKNIRYGNLNTYSIDSDLEDLQDKLRGAFCNKEKVYNEDYDKELQLAFFGSENENNIELLPFDKLISELETFSEVEKVIKKSYTYTKEYVEMQLRDVKKYEDAANKLNHSNKLKYISKISNAVNISIGITSKAISVISRACLTKISQDRKMLIYYIQNQPKED